MNRKEFLQQHSATILNALIIEDRIAWYKDMECFGETCDSLINTAIDITEKLYEEIEKKDLVP